MLVLWIAAIVSIVKHPSANSMAKGRADEVERLNVGRVGPLMRVVSPAAAPRYLMAIAFGGAPTPPMTLRGEQVSMNS